MAKVIDEKLLAEIRKHPCAQCGNPAPSDPHHIYPRGRLRLDIHENLVALCRSCHRRVEDRPIKAFEEMDGYRWYCEQLGWKIQILLGKKTLYNSDIQHHLTYQ